LRETGYVCGEGAREALVVEVYGYDSSLCAGDAEPGSPGSARVDQLAPPDRFPVAGDVEGVGGEGSLQEEQDGCVF